MLRDVEIKQLLTDAVARVDTDTERKPILDIRARIFPDALKDMSDEEIEQELAEIRADRDGAKQGDH